MPKARRRGNDGTKGSTQCRSPLNSIMQRMCNKLPPTPRVQPKEKRIYTGQKITDAEILQMRTMHDIDRMPAKEIVAAFPQYNENYLRRILQYDVRAQSHLRPKRPADK